MDDYFLNGTGFPPRETSPGRNTRLAGGRRGAAGPLETGFLWGSETHRADLSSAGSSAPADENASLTAFLRGVLGHWRALVMSAAVAVAVAGVYLLFAAPQYTAGALILIDPRANASLRSTAPTLTDANIESASIESQVEVLKSEQVLRKLVETEGLASDPALSPSLISEFIRASKAKVKDAIEAARTLVGAEPNPALAAARAQALDDRVMGAARALEKRTTVRRIGLTYAVEVAVTMPDPVQAARIANAYVHVFIADQETRREEAARTVSKLLEERTNELRAQALEAERKVEELKFSGSLQGESSAAARVALRNLESSAQTFRLLHDKFLERSAETWQQQFLAMPDAQLASPAYPPSGKASPNTMIVLAGAVFVGLALGLVRLIVVDKALIGLRG